MQGHNVYLNEHIRNYPMKDYAKGGIPQAINLDCSLGVNPEDLPPAFIAKLKTIDQDAIKHYPHDETVLDAIAGYYRNKSPELNWLTRDFMYLGNGSIDILQNLNLLFLTGGKKVLGQGPQFTAYVDQVLCLGAVYEYYAMEKQHGYKFDADKYIAKMNDAYSLFIVENPNNPTGQAIELADIERIAGKAASMNRILIVDEAYGDYLPIAGSALNLVPKYPNIVVTRTFSKGFGLAGIRLGYMITSSAEINDTLEQFKKVENQFSAGGVARLLGIGFLETQANTPDIERIKADKSAAVAALTKFKLAQTAETTPLMTLYYEEGGRDFDLQTWLYDTAGLWTVSCAGYDELDKNAARLMLPKSSQIETLKALLLKSQSLL
ncbi:MAG: aminotransferase class I/II-fold pyridoxal phosphate-dependent enzyme [Treponema sp.]|nr:aminotransferase class I/II-fold pyridoxal phosphate-dependent enzyme [Treponema sp.]